MIKIDTRAWLVWVVAVSAIALLTRNPLYLVLLLLITRLVNYTCRSSTVGAPQLAFWRLSGLILVFSTLFNMLLAHIGETVLFTLPTSWWLIGGPVTLEAAVYGFINGLSLVVILSAFLTFNAIVSSSELTRMAPSALHELGLVLLVALTYVPETLRQWDRIREAQLIRGHQVRRIRDWQPLVIPLLVGGLERSLGLAETMVARGYGATRDEGNSWSSRLLFMAGLLLALAGVTWLAWGGLSGWLLIVAGAALVVAAYWLLSRRVKRTHYRSSRWGWRDSLVTGSAVSGAFLMRLPDWFLARDALTYTPYPLVTLPPFDPLGGLAILLFVVPALLELTS